MSDFANVTNVVTGITTTPAPTFGTTTTGTLSDANTQLDITTTESGSTAYIGINLKNLANGDDFDFYLYRYNSLIWSTYIRYNITMAAGAISINSGAGAAITNLTEINYENIYIDSTHSLRILRTRNSAINRNFLYRYNLCE